MGIHTILILYEGGRLNRANQPHELTVNDMDPY